MARDGKSSDTPDMADLILTAVSLVLAAYYVIRSSSSSLRRAAAAAELEVQGDHEMKALR